MTRLQKVFAGLSSAGLSQNDALMWAERIVKASETVKVSFSTKVAHKGGDRGNLTLKERILTYARGRKGNVFTLAQMSAKFGIPGNAISAQLTHILREGTLNRIGRGEYAYNPRA